MKKSRKTMITAAILTAAAAGLTGCTNPLASEEVQDVYGPPTDTSVSSTADINSEADDDNYDPKKEPHEKVYGPPPTEESEYEPSTEPIQIEYGPVEIYEDSEADDSYEPSGDDIQTEYGAPLLEEDE